MNRFYRRAKAFIRPKEIIVFLVFVSVSVFAGCGGWTLYSGLADSSSVIVAINNFGSANSHSYANSHESGERDGAAKGVGVDVGVNVGVDGGSFAGGVGGKTARTPSLPGVGVKLSASLENRVSQGQASLLTVGYSNRISSAGAAPKAAEAEDVAINRQATEGGDQASSEGTPDAGVGGKADQSASSAAMTGVPEYVVKVIADGYRHTYPARAMTVGAFLDEKGFSLTEHDEIKGADKDTLIESDLEVEILRVSYKTVEIEETTKRKTRYKDSEELVVGDSRVVDAGEDGLRLLKYRVKYTDGIEESRDLINVDVITEKRDKIIEQGTGSASVKVGAKNIKYLRRIKVKCTAYTLTPEETGKTPDHPAWGVTKSGEKAREGIVAVDPSVIPLGSELYIDIIEEGVSDYGFSVAGDTGSKIKGKKVDLFFDTDRATAFEFGVKEAYVYILAE